VHRGCPDRVLTSPTWIRLFPVRWQELTGSKFRKYNVVELDVSKHDKDPRPDSYRPVVDRARLVKRLRHSWFSESTEASLRPEPGSHDLDDLDGVVELECRIRDHGSMTRAWRPLDAEDCDSLDARSFDEPFECLS
jgi:hypothetical protein